MGVRTTMLHNGLQYMCGDGDSSDAVWWWTATHQETVLMRLDWSLMNGDDWRMKPSRSICRIHNSQIHFPLTCFRGALLQKWITSEQCFPIRVVISTCINCRYCQTKVIYVNIRLVHLSRMIFISIFIIRVVWYVLWKVIYDVEDTLNSQLGLK